jgi:hypothetical protein
MDAVADEAPKLNAFTELLVSEMTRELESYLERGRPHANLTVSDLNSLWAPAFGAWFRSRGADDSLGYYDLDIELELRGLEPPLEVVHAELASAHAQLGVNVDGRTAAITERMLHFLRAADGSELSPQSYDATRSVEPQPPTNFALAHTDPSL